MQMTTDEMRWMEADRGLRMEGGKRGGQTGKGADEDGETVKRTGERVDGGGQ